MYKTPKDNLTKNNTKLETWVIGKSSRLVALYMLLSIHCPLNNAFGLKTPNFAVKSQKQNNFISWKIDWAQSFRLVSSTPFRSEFIFFKETFCVPKTRITRRETPKRVWMFLDYFDTKLDLWNYKKNICETFSENRTKIATAIKKLAYFNKYIKT